MPTTSVIISVFAVILSGYGLVKFRFLSLSDIQAMSRFVTYIAIPVLLFKTFATIDLPQTLPLPLWGAYYLPLLFIESTLIWYAWRWKKQHLGDSVVFALSATFSNTVLIGIPLFSLLFDDRAFYILLMVIVLHGSILLTLCFCVVDVSLQKSYDIKRLLISFFSNHLFLSMFLGVVSNLLFGPLSGHMGGMVVQWANLFAGGAAGLALVCAGGSLVQYSIRSQSLTLILFSMIKLLLFPIAVYTTASQLFALDHYTSAILCIIAALPLGVSPWVLAMHYNLSTRLPASLMLVTTPLSAITLWYLITVVFHF